MGSMMGSAHSLHSRRQSQPKPRPETNDLPLTAKQIFTLKQSWRAVQRQLEPTGANMLLILFKQHPCLKRLFTLDDYENPEQYKSITGKTLKRHAFLVMKVLDVCVKNISDLNYVTKVLKQAQEMHEQFGVSYKYFWKIKEPFLEAVKETLDERYTENVERIYVVVIDYILLKLSDGMPESECLDDGSIEEEIQTSGIKEKQEEMARQISEKSVASSQRLKMDNAVVFTSSPLLTELVNERIGDDDGNDKLSALGIV